MLVYQQGETPQRGHFSWEGIRLSQHLPHIIQNVLQVPLLERSVSTFIISTSLGPPRVGKNREPSLYREIFGGLKGEFSFRVWMTEFVSFLICPSLGAEGRSWRWRKGLATCPKSRSSWSAGVSCDYSGSLSHHGLSDVECAFSSLVLVFKAEV